MVALRLPYRALKSMSVNVALRLSYRALKRIVRLGCLMVALKLPYRALKCMSVNVALRGGSGLSTWKTRF